MTDWKSKKGKRITISFLITIGFLTILLIPFIEFIDWGFIESFAVWIHWPLFGIAFFGETGGVISFLILWYAGIIGIGTSIIYYIMQAIASKSK
mgnify:CR=1 FL=1